MDQHFANFPGDNGMLLTHRAGWERLPLNSLRCSPADTASSPLVRIAKCLLLIVSVFGPHTSLVVAQAQSSKPSANEQKINRPATGDGVEYDLTLLDEAATEGARPQDSFVKAIASQTHTVALTASRKLCLRLASKRS